MSSLIVKVRRFKKLVHSNADSLFISVPDGTNWQCCVRKDQFENEDLGIYIPIDSILPYEMASDLNLLNVQENEPYRVRTCRLRSKLSQGLFIPNKGRFKEGEDVAEILGITKHVEPEPDDKNLRPFPQEFVKYTSIENIKNYPTVLKDGEDVVFSEKLHGSTFRCAWSDGEFYVGSATTAFKPDVNSKWMDVAKKYDLIEKLREHPNLVVYGELFGAGVQKLRYGLEDSWDLRIFDIYIGTEDRYANYDEFLEFAKLLGCNTVPILYRGPYSEAILTECTEGSSTLAEHVREGTVVKCTTERWDFDSGLGRVILKSLNPKYLLKQLD